jgi:hypothetical protein
VVPHRGTNWAAPWLTSQIGRDAVLSRSYGRGYLPSLSVVYVLHAQDPSPGFKTLPSATHTSNPLVQRAVDWNDIDMAISHGITTEMEVI